MKVSSTFLLLSMSGLFFSCSQPEKVEKTDKPVISSTIQIDSLQAENTTAKVQPSGGPVKDTRKLNQPLLDGEWIHEEDDQASVTINGTNWVFNYEGEVATEEDKYQVSIVDKLPRFVDPNVDAEFLVLSNKSDTLNYELNGLTAETLSLTYYPSGKTHVYKRK